MDDFSWGNTRMVVGEGSNKRVVVQDEEKFDESMIPLKKFSGAYPIFQFRNLSRALRATFQNTRQKLGKQARIIRVIHDELAEP